MGFMEPQKIEVAWPIQVSLFHLLVGFSGELNSMGFYMGHFAYKLTTVKVSAAANISFLFCLLPQFAIIVSLRAASGHCSSVIIQLYNNSSIFVRFYKKIAIIILLFSSYPFIDSNFKFQKTHKLIYDPDRRVLRF